MKWTALIRKLLRLARATPARPHQPGTRPRLVNLR